MPRRSARTQLEEGIVCASIVYADGLLRDAEEEDQHDDAERADDAIVEATLAVQAIQVLQQQRYLRDRAPVARVDVTLGQRLVAYEKAGDHLRFRQLVRMEPEAFHRIVAILAEDPIFRPVRGRPASVEDQVAVAMFRFGHDGNGASVKNTAEVSGFSEGSIVNFTRRTVQALCKLEERVLCWPNQAEKEESKTWVEDRCGVPEWRDGFASVDGVHINCAWAPGLDHGDAFMNRKHRFSFNVQLVTMVHTLRIISYVVGHRGASSDSRAWSCSSIVEGPAKYLGAGEWIWADLGYPYAPYLVSPYQHMAATKSVDFRRFNYYLSSIRIRSEHAMAYVKGRFPALKGYRGLLLSTDAESYAHDFILAALVAHNLAMINDAAGRYLHYVKEGLERAMVAADYDWFSAQDENIERAAVAQRQTSHQSWLERQQFEAQQYSLADRDDIRIDAAKERREALHDSLNRAKGLTFEDTTWRSRFKELSRQQLVILEQRQVDRRILT